MDNMFEEEEFEGKKVEAKVWFRILKELGAYKKNLILLACLMSFQALIDLIIPLLNAHAVDNFIGNHHIDMNAFKQYILLYAALVIIQAIAVYFFFTQSGKIEMGLSYSLRDKLFKKLQNLSFEYYDVNSSGWILARLTGDIGRIAEIVSWSMTDLLWGVILIISESIVMFKINTKLSLIVICIIPLLFVITKYFQKRILVAHRASRKVNSKITSAFNEGIMGAKTIKTLNIEERQYQDFTALTSEYRSKAIKGALLNAIFMPLIMLCETFIIALLIYFAGGDAISGAISYGTFTLFINYTQNFFNPLQSITGLMSELQMCQANAERVVGLLEKESAIVDSEEVIEKYGTITNPKSENYEPLKGDISFKDVTFYYNPNEIVLSHFNLDIKAGQTIALVGETGSGKSSIVNLVCRFYEPKEGQILIDGEDYKARSLGWLHSNLGYVLQTPYLFSGTIRDNIKYGKKDASDEEVIRAAKMVNVHDFIMSLENGYDTIINEGGSRLSTGEKQLISFARALIVNPAILVLDEATASIDTEKEKAIQEAISVVKKNRTCLMVAHRLSTVVDADRILVLDKGVIVEDGTHQELLNLKGRYYRLYTNQFKEMQQKSILKIREEA